MLLDFIYCTDAKMVLDLAPLIVGNTYFKTQKLQSAIASLVDAEQQKAH